MRRHLRTRYKSQILATIPLFRHTKILQTLTDRQKQTNRTADRQTDRQGCAKGILISASVILHRGIPLRWLTPLKFTIVALLKARERNSAVKFTSCTTLQHHSLPLSRLETRKYWTYQSPPSPRSSFGTCSKLVTNTRELSPPCFILGIFSKLVTKTRELSPPRFILGTFSKLVTDTPEPKPPYYILGTCSKLVTNTPELFYLRALLSWHFPSSQLTHQNPNLHTLFSGHVQNS